MRQLSGDGAIRCGRGPVLLRTDKADERSVDGGHFRRSRSTMRPSPESPGVQQEGIGEAIHTMKHRFSKLYERRHACHGLGRASFPSREQGESGSMRRSGAAFNVIYGHARE